MKQLVAIAALVGAALAGAAALAATAVAADPRGAATAPEFGHGKQVFAHWCAPCHGPAPRLAGTLALQTKYNGDVPPALEDRTDLTPEVVAYFVRTGVAWMPPFRKTEISDADLAAIGAYLSAPMKDRGPHAAQLYAEMTARKEAGQ